MKAEDRVAVRLVDGHGVVAVVRIDRTSKAYLRTKAFSMHNLYWLDDMDPASVVALACRKGKHVLLPVAVSVLQGAVDTFRTTGKPEELKLPQEHLDPFR